MRIGDHVELGGGGQVAVEPFIAGNRNSSYVTPDVNYEDFARKEVLRRFVERTQLGVEQFPRPVPSAQTNVSWRAVGYLGFGKLGPLKWNNFFARYQRLHPQNSYTDAGKASGAGLHRRPHPRSLRAAAGQRDGDRAHPRPPRRGVVDALRAGPRSREHDRRQRGEPPLHVHGAPAAALLLPHRALAAGERDVARSARSTATSSAPPSTRSSRTPRARPTRRGLEFGDSNVRNTWQLKTGIVLNPTGFGIYARPSIRLLYGFQHLEPARGVRQRLRRASSISSMPSSPRGPSRGITWCRWSRRGGSDARARGVAGALVVCRLSAESSPAAPLGAREGGGRVHRRPGLLAGRVSRRPRRSARPSPPSSTITTSRWWRCRWRPSRPSG